MKRKVVGVLLILTIAIAGLASLWFALPETYSALNELVLAPVNSLPNNWEVIDEPKWGIRLSIPPGLKEQAHGNLWIHENDSLKVIIDFGAERLISNVSEQVRLKTAGLKKNYAQKIITHNGLKNTDLLLRKVIRR